MLPRNQWTPLQVSVTHRHITHIINNKFIYLVPTYKEWNFNGLVEKYFSWVKNKQFTYIWSEKSGILVTSPNTQLQGIALIPRWLISLDTMSIWQVMHKVTWKYNLTIHQVKNLIPSLQLVVYTSSSRSKGVSKI